MAKRLPKEIEWIEILPSGATVIRHGAPWCESGPVYENPFNARYWVIAFDEPGQFQLIGEASKVLRKRWKKFYSPNAGLRTVLHDMAKTPEGTLFLVSRGSRVGDVESEYAFRKPWFAKSRA